MSAYCRYAAIDRLPKVLPVFPLRQALLLPRGQLPLNIFEPRYLAMVDAAMAGDRLIGMVQPARGCRKDEVPQLAAAGTAGRITSYSETADGRYLITLTGISRFRIGGEEQVATPFRQCHVDYTPYACDLTCGYGEDEVDRAKLLKMFAAYLECHALQVDWEGICAASTESLVNALSMLSPYGAEAKQALLEAESLKQRAELLMAFAEMDIKQAGEEPGTMLQ